MMGWCDGGMMAGLWLVWFLWLLIVGGVIALIVWAVLRGRAGDSPVSQLNRDTALATLRQRFAAGEIVEAEYRARLAVLEST